MEKFEKNMKKEGKQKMKSRLIALITATMVMALTFSGCSGSTTTSTATPEASAAGTTDAAATTTAGTSSEDTIKIGIGAPLTGTDASYGQLMVDGANIAIEEINAAGGVNGKMLELVALDDKNDPKEAAIVAQRFCDDEDIVAVISHGGSSQTLAAEPIYEKAKMPNMSPSSSNKTITELGYQYYVRNGIRDDRQSPQVVALLHNNLKLNKIAVIYANNDYGRGNLDSATAAAADLGCEVVDTETYNPGLEKDFSTMIAKIQKAGAEGVAIYADHTDAGLILKQAYDLGLDIPFVGQSGLTYQNLIDLATPAALQKLSICVTFNPYSDRPAVVNFMEKFKELHPDQIPSEPCAGCYDIIKIFSKALSQGATKANLAQWIKNTTTDKTEKFVMEDECCLADNLIWDEYGDVEPIGVSILKVNTDGEFINTDEKVDITGLSAFNIVG